ncbi:MAG: type II toxin-antitoxin system VapC family toxin [Candidatus Bathyarchaeia archaeon]
MLRLYLDSSTIVKRYVTEPGTPITDLIFDRAESGELIVTLSLWNIGEVFGVLDERCRRGWLSERELKEALKMLSGELSKLMRLRVLELIPILASILVETWGLILNYHIYEADALQITTCTYTKSDALLSGDENLVKTSRELGLKAFDIVKEEQKLTKFLKT